MGKYIAASSAAPPEVPDLNALNSEAAELARLLALAPDAETERRRQELAARWNRRAAPRDAERRAERVNPDRREFGLESLGGGSHAKARTDCKIDHVYVAPSGWGGAQSDEPKRDLRQHAERVQAFGAVVQHDRVDRARPKSAVPTTLRPRPRAHRPGATRRAASSSRSSGSDPGSDSSDDSSDEPEPPSHGRLCAALWCSHPVYGASQKRYCGTPRCDDARAEERQRRHRHGDDLSAQEREALAAARAARMVGGEAFALGLPAEPHSLSFLWKFRLVDGPDPGELEALLNRPPCRCNGHHIDGGAVGCFKCGLSREAVVA